MRRRESEEFAEVVKRLTEGKSLRAISRTTKVSHTYVDDMRWGIIPSYVVLAQFADGLELSPEDRSELFKSAGYEGDTPAPSTPTGAEVLDAGLQQLAEQLGRALRIQFDEADKAKLSVLDAAEALAVYRKQAEEGLI